MSAAGTITRTLRINATHPSLPGHFPGQPVVPGVVLLDRIAAALEDARRGQFTRIGMVKFLAPLLPDEDAEISATIDGARVSFRVERSGATILKGEGSWNE